MPLRFVSGENGTSITRSKTTSAGSAHAASASIANDHGPLRLVQPFRRRSGRGYARVSASSSFTRPPTARPVSDRALGRFPDDDARTSSLSDHTRLRPESKTSVSATRVGNDTKPCAGCATRRVSLSCAAPGRTHGTSFLGGVSAMAKNRKGNRGNRGGGNMSRRDEDERQQGTQGRDDRAQQGSERDREREEARSGSKSGRRRTKGERAVGQRSVPSTAIRAGLLFRRLRPCGIHRRPHHPNTPNDPWGASGVQAPGRPPGQEKGVTCG